jgi:hypothetical protein
MGHQRWGYPTCESCRIDPVEDQVRLYPLDDRSARQVTVIGARVIEERQG